MFALHSIEASGDNKEEVSLTNQNNSTAWRLERVEVVANATHRRLYLLCQQPFLMWRGWVGEKVGCFSNMLLRPEFPEYCAPVDVL